MQSAAHRGFTVVTIVTLAFTPMLKGHHWVDMLTGRTETTTIVDCSSAKPCPDQHHVVQRVVLPPAS